VKRYLLVAALLLAGCAPSRKPPSTQPKPPGTVPAPPTPTTPAPEKPAEPVECATCCPADAPEATGYRWYQGGMSNPALKMVCAIAVTNSPAWCRERFEDPRQHGVCSYFEECDPRKPDNGCERRDDCLRKKGLPTWSGNIVEVRANNPICITAEVGQAVTACAPSGACGSYTVQP